MDMISEYIKTALELERLDSTDTKTKLGGEIQIYKNNKLADKLRDTAIKINADYPELKEDFFQLIYHQNKTVRNWVVFQILDAMDYDFEHRKKAMSAIKNRVERAEESDLFPSMFELWLGHHPEYKELL